MCFCSVLPSSHQVVSRHHEGAQRRHVQSADSGVIHRCSRRHLKCRRDVHSCKLIVLLRHLLLIENIFCDVLQVEDGVSAVKKDYYRALRNFVALLPAQIPVDLEFLLP